jgi:tetratricopeptide (TPR) repeat protein
MSRHQLLCYSSLDAQTFAARISNTLSAESQPIQLLPLDDENAAEPTETIRACASVLFVVTPASIAVGSPCMRVWTQALRYKKPIVPLILDPAARLPAQLQTRKPIDGTAVERGLAQLRSRIQQLDTPKGRLQALKERLADAEDQLRQEQEPPRQLRVRDEIALLKQQIEQLQRVADDPQRAAKRAGIDIERQIERERYTGLPSVEPQQTATPDPAAPDALALLRTLDADGKLGLRDAPAERLDQLLQHTQSQPRAIEVLAAILAADANATLTELLDELPSLPPVALTEWLLAEAFDRLDPIAQQIMQALAIFKHPVTASAVNYLLLPWLFGLKSEPMLKRLVALRLIRQHNDRFALLPGESNHALRRLPEDDLSERGAKSQRFTRLGLLRRAAEYFKQARLPEKSWNSPDDLAAQLAEFELRCAADEYAAAASLLLTIGPRLSAWSQHRLLIQLNEQLADKLDDYRLALLTSDQLAAAYQSLGEYEAALRYHQRSLEIARQHNDRAGEGIGLGKLGQHWLLLGRPAQAMEQLKPALLIARETKDQHATQSRLLGLGLCAKEIGATRQALDYDQQALEIARRLGDKGSESVILGNIGLCYADLGESARALDFLQQAQAVARAAGAQANEGTALVNQAIVLIDREQYAEAEQQIRHSAAIAQQIGSARLSSFSSRFLALARLFSGDLSTARDAAEAALLHRSPEHTQHVLALLGVIALRRHDHDQARARLVAAIDEADALLIHTPELFKALDTKALALMGLSLLDDGQHLPAAIEAYRAARTINRDAGIVRRALRLLDTLAMLDNARMLAQVRVAAAGTDDAES